MSLLQLTGNNLKKVSGFSDDLISSTIEELEPVVFELLVKRLNKKKMAMDIEEACFLEKEDNFLFKLEVDEEDGDNDFYVLETATCITEDGDDICVLQEEDGDFLYEEDLDFIIPEGGNCIGEVTITKVFSNSQEECIYRTFRVEGKCKTPPPSCGLPPCPSKYIANIYACNINDVLDKIEQKNLVSAIDNIKVFDDNNCLTTVDFSSKAEDCELDFCDIFLDENTSTDTQIDASVLFVFDYNATGSISIYGDSSYSNSVNGGGNYSVVASGIVSLSGEAGTSSSGYLTTGDGTVVLSSGGSYSYYPTYSVLAEGLVSFTSDIALGFSSLAEGNVSFSSGSSYSLSFNVLAEGTIALDGVFTTISSNHSYNAIGEVSLSSSFVVLPSDLGTFEVDLIYVDSVDLDDVEFAFVDADEYLTVIENQSACSTSISQVLQVKHNLNNLLPLNYFLLRNGLLFEDVVSLTYNKRLGVWSSNFHFKNTWNILFELECDTDWKFSMTVYFRDTYDAIARFLFIFDKDVFSPENEFNRFEFEFDFVNVDSAKMTVFHDEADLFSSFSEDLHFEIFSTESRNNQLDFVDLNASQLAVVEIA